VEAEAQRHTGRAPERAGPCNTIIDESSGRRPGQQDPWRIEPFADQASRREASGAAQNELASITSLHAFVPSAHQVGLLMESLMARTEPSIRSRLTTPLCRLDAAIAAPW
jgi:hypothetical protein